MTQVTITKIDNGYLVQDGGHMFKTPSVQYAKDLDAVFAAVERMFEESSKKIDKP